MRVLIAHSFYRTFGGEDRYANDQAGLLRRAGHDVSVMRRKNTELQSGPRTAIQMAYSRKVVQEVRADIRAASPEVIHLHNPYPAFGPAVHIVARQESIPLVFTTHNLRLRCPNGLMFTEGSVCRRCEGGAYFNSFIHECFPTKAQGFAYGVDLWLHRFVMKLERNIDAFISPSRFLAHRLVEWGFPPERVTQIPYATHIPKEPPNIPEGAHGAFIGRVSVEKGVDGLLSALSRAGDPPFVVVGDGPLLSESRDLATRLSLRNVTFVGRVGEQGVREALERSSYLVVPSRWEENYPLSVAEALAHGRPVIVSDRGGLPELAADGRGIVCDPEDPSAFADAIGNLAADLALCRTMGARGRAFAAEELSDEVHVRRLESVYESVIEA